MFCKMPNGKAVVATLNKADTPNMVRKKVEVIAKQGKLDTATLVYGVEEMAEDKCLADYDVVPDSTIRLTMGGGVGSDGKKWNVEQGAMVRGAVANIKVDYGRSGIAPPSSKVGNDTGLNKLKGAADVVKVKNMMQKMQAQMATEAEAEEETQETDEEKRSRLQAAKARKLSVMRHAVRQCVVFCRHGQPQGRKTSP